MSPVRGLVLVVALGAVGAACTLDSTITVESTSTGSGGASTQTGAGAAGATASVGGGATTASGGGGEGPTCVAASAVQFDGDDDRMTAPSVGTLLFDADAFGAGALVTLDATAAAPMTILGRDGVTAGFALTLTESGGDLFPHFQVMIDEGAGVTSLCEVDAPDPLLLATKTHVLGAFAHDISGSNELSIFVDGTAVVTDTCNDGVMLAADPTTVRFVVGFGAEGPFHGDLDDVFYVDVPPFADFDPATFVVACGPRDSLWRFDCFDVGGQLAANACNATLPLGRGATSMAEALDPTLLP